MLLVMTTASKKLLDAAASIMTERSNEESISTEQLHLEATAINLLLSKVGAGELVIANKVDGTVLGFVPSHLIPTQEENN